MKELIVWVLVTVGGYNGNEVVYSPPMPDVDTCLFLQDNMPVPWVRSKCVQIKVIK